MQITIDPERCICSEACTRRAPATFFINDEYRAEAFAEPGDDLTTILAAERDCPVGAITVLTSS